MNPRTLFLGWREPRSGRRFPVGRLDADVERPLYRFRYIHGAKRAQKEARFPLALDFPELRKDYRSPELFALFRNRVIAPGRPDRLEYLSRLALPEDADPIEILSVNSGQRMTDFYEVFPQLDKRRDGSFACRFLLHGWSHVEESAKHRVGCLREGEALNIKLETANANLAVQARTMDDHIIGWAPRYFVRDLAAAMKGTSKCSAHVVRVAPQTSPAKQRVLIEMQGCWDGHEPMTDEDYLPLVA